ncbi:BolA family protein [uncultured Cohaesibacter sp.]|uniref:BolA family protein n=1 Tax=uncultured Cohaesibacter sp. TaxID=1002546 RepID=UPI0029C90DF9|nr:BolA family protein [uncultured Cohaesibacter sp.]
MTVKNILEKKLNNQLQPTALEVIDESHLHAGHAHSRPEGETHFRIRIASPAFSGKSRVDAHRMVHDVIKDELDGPIHALALETIRPE